MKWAQTVLDAGMDLLDKGRVPQGVSKLRYSISIAGFEGPGAEAFNKLVSLHDEAVLQLQRAAELHTEGDYARALDIVEDVKANYANLLAGMDAARKYADVAMVAREVAERIKADPNARPALRERTAAKAYAKVQKLLARVDEDPSLYYGIHKNLKSIARRFPTTPTGQRCERELGELMEDAEIRAVIEKEGKRRFIASTLEAAEHYRRCGLPDKAEAEMAKLAKQFPGESAESLRKRAK